MILELPSGVNFDGLPQRQGGVIGKIPSYAQAPGGKEPAVHRQITAIELSSNDANFCPELRHITPKLLGAIESYLIWRQVLRTVRREIQANESVLLG